MIDRKNSGMTEGLHHKGEADFPTVLRRFSYLLSATWVRDGLQAIILVYLARKSSTIYGQFILALSLGQIVHFISEFGINQHLVSLLVRKETNASRVLNQVAALKAALLGIGWLGMLGFVSWQGYPGELQGIVLALATGVGLEALASSFFVSCQVQGRQDHEGKVRLVSTIFGFGYGIVTLSLGAAPLVVAFYKLIENSCNLLGMVLLARNSMRFRFHRPRFQEIWTVSRASMDLTLMAIATVLYNRANIFFLQRFGGADGIAQYSATWQIVDWISCLVSSLLLRRVLFPLFSGLWEESRERFVRLARNSVSWLLMAAFPIMFILFVESDRIIPLIYGPGYSSAVWMQKILVVTILTGFVHNLAADIMISMGRERLLLIFYVTGLLFNLFFCATLIPGAPLMGTVLAIVLTKALVAVMTVGYCQFRLRMVTGQFLLQLCLAISTGQGFYFLLRGTLPRELVELAAMAPVLGLTWTWRHRLFSGQTHESAVESPGPSSF